MPYVERDSAGKIKGIYGLSQPGYAEELIGDASPEIAEFRARSAALTQESHPTKEILQVQANALLAQINALLAKINALP